MTTIKRTCTVNTVLKNHQYDTSKSTSHGRQNVFQSVARVQSCTCTVDKVTSRHDMISCIMLNERCNKGTGLLPRVLPTTPVT